MNFKSSVLLFCVLLIMGCAPKVSLQSADVYPVKWFPDFDLAERLANKAHVHSQQDVQALLDKPWYMPFKLIHLQTRQELNADRCSQILPEITQLETYLPYQSHSYRYLAVMCVAAESIAKARPAQYSALSKFKLDADLPHHLSKNLAFFNSSSEKQRILKNKAIVSWAEVEKVDFVSKESEYRAKYALKGAFQELSLIARGDFNHDGIEDLLLYTIGYVVGGSYVAYHLFWVTKKNTNSPITLIREYPIPKFSTVSN